MVGCLFPGPTSYKSNRCCGISANAGRVKTFLGETSVLSKFYVGNVSYDCTEAELKEFFGPSARSAKIIVDKETRRSRGFAFIECECEKPEDVIWNFDGQDLMGRTLRVREANPRGDANPRHGDRHARR